MHNHRSHLMSRHGRKLHAKLTTIIVISYRLREHKHLIALIVPFLPMLPPLLSLPHPALLHPWTLTPTNVALKLGHAITVASELIFLQHTLTPARSMSETTLQ